MYYLHPDCLRCLVCKLVPQQLFAVLDPSLIKIWRGLPGSLVVKNLPANAREMEDPGRSHVAYHGTTKPMCHNY